MNLPLVSRLLPLARSMTMRRVAETFGTQIVVLCIGFATSVVIARALGPQGRGFFAVAATISAIGIQFGTLGLHTANTYAAARDRGALGGLIANSAVVVLVAGTLGIGVLWLVVELLGTAPVPDTVLLLTLYWIPLGLAFSLTEHLLLGLDQVPLYNGMELGYRAIVLLVIVGLAATTTLTVGGAVAASLVGLSTCVLIGGRRLVSLSSTPVRPDRNLFRGLLGYSVRIYVSSVAAYLVLRSDLLIVRYEVGATQAGYYSVAGSLAELLYLLSAAGSAVTFPRLAALTGRGEKWRQTRRAAGLIAVATVATAGLLALAARPLVPALYGERFSPAATPLLILCLAMVPYATNNLFANYVSAIGSPWWGPAIWVAGAVLNVALNLVLVPRFGIAGAAWCSVATYSLITFANYVGCVRSARASSPQL